MKIIETGLLYKTDYLKKLILENPELPLLVFAGSEACPEDWCSCACSDVRAEIGEFLDAETDFMSYYDDAGMCYEDRIQFEEDLADWLEDNERENHPGMTEDEWDAEVERRIREFDPYWKKCIILRVDN